MASRGGQDPQVVAGAATGVEGGVFEHRSDAGGGPLELVVAQAAERGRARRRPHEPEQRAQRRALAGPVGTEEAGHATGLDVEGETLDGGDVAEALGEIADLDGGHASAPRSDGVCGHGLSLRPHRRPVIARRTRRCSSEAPIFGAAASAE